MGEEIERSLEASRREGVVSQVALGVLDYYMIPFALLLGATTPQIGLLIALPNLLSALSQFFVVDVVKFLGDRRRVLLVGAVIQAALLLPMPVLALTHLPSRFETCFALIAAFRIIGAIMLPAWGSLVADYLPPDRRGSYLGRRSKHVGLSGMTATALFGLLLYLLRQISPGAAFGVIFMIAAAARFWSYRYMARMVNLPEHHTPAESFHWRNMAARLRRSNFARFTIYIAAVTFAAQLSSAYLSVHMLRDLGFDYMSYTGVQLCAAAASFLSFPIWGRHADHVGNVKVLKLNSLLLPVVPLLLTLGESPAWLCAVELLDGFVWAGFNLCSANFIYDHVPGPKRVRALGYYNLLNGLAIFTGAMVGGWLADRLPPVGGYSLHTLFLVAAAARLAADFALSGKFREERPNVRHASSFELFFSVVGLRPLVGDNVELEWDGAPERAAAAGASLSRQSDAGSST